MVLALTLMNDATSLFSPLALSFTVWLQEVCVHISKGGGFWGAVQVMWLMQSDLISCKCKRSEGIHFGLRAPLCTAMKY